ncbi:MAG: transglycosylase domain-containing protein [Leptospiraceae bacterium]|nr:transglycosylase domain-containing protein [Leptospiraceae bacterium]
MKTVLPILKSLLSFLIKIFPSVMKGAIISLFTASVFIFGGSYVVWMKEKDKVKANLDKYKAEVTNYYDASSTKPVRIFDKSGTIIGEFHRKSYKPIRTDNLVEHGTMVWALLSSEDRDFYKHSGINYKSLFRAFYINITQFKLAQGGSTITQQLAKLTLNLGERNVFNKITEGFCAYYIERQYDKDTILSMYMNQIFLGEGNIGLEEAARYYFNKPATNLSPAEAALLTGIIPAPSVYNPVRNLKISLDRQRRILEDMAKNKSLHKKPELISKKFDDSIREQIQKFKTNYNVKEVESQDKKKFISEIGKYGYDRDFKLNRAPDFNESIRKLVLEKFTSEALERKSLNVYTTLDIQKQEAAQTLIQDGVSIVKTALEKRKAEYAKEGDKEEVAREKEIIDGMNSSLVSLNPFNGHVEALVGAYKISSIYRLNRAEESKRQPGSSIKGLVYALALERRVINPSSIVVDEKINFGGYSPRNWYGGYKGKMTARQALAQSVNTVSVKLLNEVGIDYFLNKLSAILNTTESDLKERFGNNLSLGLGSGELSPMELAIIYSTIANGGYRITPKKILKITDSDGVELFVPEEEGQKVQIIDPIACAMAINLMEAVLSEEGTMSLKLKGEKFPLAGKTGTVQTPQTVQKKWSGRKGVRDTWFAGIIPGLVTTIWIGNDNGAPFPGSGSGNSGQVWVRYSLFIKKNLDIQDALIRPFEGDYVRVDICGETGEILSDDLECKYPLYKQYYYKGDEPRAKIIDQQTLEELKKDPEFEIKHEEEGVDLNEPTPDSENYQPKTPKEPPQENVPEKKENQ